MAGVGIAYIETIVKGDCVIGGGEGRGEGTEEGQITGIQQTVPPMPSQVGS